MAFIYVFVTILSKPILYVQWLAGFPFCEAVIVYNLLFQKLHPFLHPFFFFWCFALLAVWKIETLSNPVDVRLIPCLVQWMIS